MRAGITSSAIPGQSHKPSSSQSVCGDCPALPESRRPPRASWVACQQYGYLWWTTEYQHRGRTVHAYFASGNGGQEVVVIPALDLVVATYGGSYGDRGGWVMIREYIPSFILPALVDETR
jgi:CubicO group peptidase (beta-lactamase class C family)